MVLLSISNVGKGELIAGEFKKQLIVLN